MASKWEKEAGKIKELLELGKTSKEMGNYFGTSASNMRNIMSDLREKGLLPERDEIFNKEEKKEPVKNIQEMDIDFLDKKEKDFDWKDFLNTAIDFQEQKKKKSMSQKEANINITTDKPFAIAFSSDWHLGSSGTDYVSFLKHTELITKVPNLLVAALGDLGDNFVQTSKKGGMFSALFPPGDQQDLIKEIFKELGNNVIFKTSGNHDNWTYLETGIDAARYMFLNSEKAPYLREGGGINITVNGEIEYRIYAKHKYRYNSSFNLTHTVKRMFEKVSPFDVGVIAHHHTPAIEQVSRWEGRYKKEPIFIRTGSYKIDDKWAREQGFVDAAIGVPTVVFWPNEKRMVPFRRIEDAVLFLESLDSVWDNGKLKSKYLD